MYLGAVLPLPISEAQRLVRSGVRRRSCSPEVMRRRPRLKAVEGTAQGEKTLMKGGCGDSRATDQSLPVAVTATQSAGSDGVSEIQPSYRHPRKSSPPEVICDSDL